ncbi:MAG: hypothetical protein HY344_03790 [Candidatus Levybacteria bacterium]|nr:hypothetical protein [Candidatus Levybacteria bacterium]
MDFKFIEDIQAGRWIIAAPKRSKRPNALKGTEPVCPFCVGQEGSNPEVYRIPSDSKETEWKVRVIKNKYPFAPLHEIIVHSPDHHKSFDELPLDQSQLVLKAFRQRFNDHKDKGSVYIFTNSGEEAGESLPHPHSQLVVIPSHVKLSLPHHKELDPGRVKETSEFSIFCPYESQWPDEVWLYPKVRDKFFGEITDDQIRDLSKALYRLLGIFDLRHGHEFPYNLYIYPYSDWYLRLVPRYKIIGGFEVGTNVFVNTQDSQETIDFIKEHFDTPDEEKIRSTHRAKYHRFS